MPFVTQPLRVSNGGNHLLLGAPQNGAFSTSRSSYRMSLVSGVARSFPARYGTPCIETMSLWESMSKEE